MKRIKTSKIKEAYYDIERDHNDYVDPDSYQYAYNEGMGEEWLEGKTEEWSYELKENPMAWDRVPKQLTEDEDRFLKLMNIAIESMASKVKENPKIWQKGHGRTDAPWFFKDNLNVLLSAAQGWKKELTNNFAWWNAIPDEVKEHFKGQLLQHMANVLQRAIDSGEDIHEVLESKKAGAIPTPMRNLLLSQLG